MSLAGWGLGVLCIMRKFANFLCKNYDCVRFGRVCNFVCGKTVRGFALFSFFFILLIRLISTPSSEFRFKNSNSFPTSINCKSSNKNTLLRYVKYFIEIRRYEVLNHNIGYLKFLFSSSILFLSLKPDLKLFGP